MTKARLISTSALMPAGEYWVGDPCYSVPDERWHEWLDLAGSDNYKRVLLAELDGKPVIGINTSSGDGYYTDEQGRGYSVDAGLIGLTPVSLVTEDEPFSSHKVIFENDFECHYIDGKIVLGHITIDTS